MAEWLNAPVLADPLWLWGVAALLAAGSFLALRLVQRLVVARLESLARRTLNKLDDLAAAVLRKTHWVSLLAIGILAGSMLLELGEKAVALRRALVAVALLQAGSWGATLLRGLLTGWREARPPDAAAAMALAAAGFLGKIAIWAVVALVALDNLGVEVTALLAGLGIGGVAIALAVQNVLGDLFACLSIILDRPFEIGDFVVVGDLMGTVEHVGLKTTRLRSLSGEQLVFSNADLLSSRIRNFKRMYERRVVFTIGVTYQTPHEKLAAIPAMLREIVQAQEKVRFDRAHFSRYGDFALQFEVVYFVQSPDYNLHMDIQQAINLLIRRRFEEEGIALAYPTQTVFLHGAAEPGWRGGKSC
ncbi:MAG: mechanosensitive ion channel family protein [Planctomycetes bacterium]|nr:mechanosensitive ion channel family protein [Planctomycetota bacterium]